jgi:hypothetical protein
VGPTLDKLYANSWWSSINSVLIALLQSLLNRADSAVIFTNNTALGYAACNATNRMVNCFINQIFWNIDLSGWATSDRSFPQIITRANLSQNVHQNWSQTLKLNKEFGHKMKENYSEESSIMFGSWRQTFPTFTLVCTYDWSSHDFLQPTGHT